MRQLRTRHIRLINETSLDFVRDYINKLPFDNRLMGIKGFRGVGKTTVLLQYIKKHYGDSEKALYITLDDLYFTENKLINLAEDFISMGGQHLFIDEVHKYKNWSVELKNIYDTYKNIKITFTGSSLLEILGSRGDLSRRALVFNMQGLSFREYLNMNHKTKFPILSLEEILKNHTKKAVEIAKKIKPLPEFEKYLKYGYFPFFKESEEWYYKRLNEILNMIIEIELPSLRKTEVSAIPKIKLLLYIISKSVPFKPNISSLASRIGASRKSVLEYISYMTDARILNSIYKDSKGIGLLQKPDKIYLENTNFSYGISYNEPNIGNIRESFFLNQLYPDHRINEPETGDFLIDGKYLFEVGGKNKDYSQISGIKNSFIAADNIEFGTGNKIPLWLFGFLY